FRVYMLHKQRHFIIDYAESAAQLERARVALDEDRLDHQRPAHLVANVDSAHCGGADLFDLSAQLAWQLLRKGEGQPAGPLGVHEDTRTLQIEGAVASRGKHEMAFEQRVAGPEFGENLVFGHDWGRAFRSVSRAIAGA